MLTFFIQFALYFSLAGHYFQFPFSLNTMVPCISVAVVFDLLVGALIIITIISGVLVG